MTSMPTRQFKSADQKAFGHYLRTGQRLTTSEWQILWERKFNPNHDPENGRFTFGSGSGDPSRATASMASRRTSGAAPYPVRFALPPSKPVQVEQSQQVRFRHSAGLDLPEPVVAKANELSDAVRTATGHEIHVTSGRRAADRQAVAMYNNYLDNTAPHYMNKIAESEVKRAYDKGQKAGLTREQIVREMTTALHNQIKRGIYLSPHMRSGAIDIRTPSASVLRVIRNHPTVKSVGVENDHIHVQFR